jgi:hypothetical protein
MQVTRVHLDGPGSGPGLARVQIEKFLLTRIDSDSMGASLKKTVNYGLIYIRLPSILLKKCIECVVKQLLRSNMHVRRRSFTEKNGDIRRSRMAPICDARVRRLYKNTE